MANERAKAAGMGALQSLGCYFILYFIYVHLFVALKWNSTLPTRDQFKVVIVNPSVDDTSYKSSSRNLESADKLLQDIMQAQVKEENDATIEDVRDLLDQWKKQLSKWSDRDKDPNASFLSNGTIKFSSSMMDLTKELLQQTSLSEGKDTNDFTLRMKAIDDELETLLQRRMVVSWAEIHEILGTADDESFPSKEKWSADALEEMLCLSPVVPPDDENAIGDGDRTSATVKGDDDDTSDGVRTVKDRSLYASEDDLEVHWSDIEAVLNSRMSNPQERFQNSAEVMALMQESRKTLKGAFADADGIVENMISESIEGADDKPASSSSTSSGCHDAADASIILDLVNAGLNALARNQDLRTELLRGLAELDAASAENLILDADFKMEPFLPTIPYPQEMSAQRVLVDTPLLPHLAAGLDKILDIVGGYNDSLDHYVDQLQERLVDVSNEEKSSLGKVFASTLLVQSGHVRIPIPEPVQKILQQSNRGRAILASVA